MDDKMVEVGNIITLERGTELLIEGECKNMYIASVGDKPSHRKYLVEDVDPGDGDEYIRVIGKLELCDDIDDRD
ncbi:MAG: hypothetical protein K6G22_08300, partial [Lachnospiraceae bacterium]|nr:hypothetical protein [Lachnospiraceae bacterium]